MCLMKTARAQTVQMLCNKNINFFFQNLSPAVLPQNFVYHWQSQKNGENPDPWFKSLSSFSDSIFLLALNNKQAK